MDACREAFVKNIENSDIMQGNISIFKHYHLQDAGKSYKILESYWIQWIRFS